MSFLVNPYLYGNYNIDTIFDKVISLVHFEGDTTDQIPHTLYFGPTGCSISTGRFKFGSSSLLLTGGTVQTSKSSVTALVTDFTIEGSYYFNNLSSSGTILDMRPQTNGAYPAIAVLTDGTILMYYNTATQITSAPGAIIAGGWQTIALSRVSGVWRLFVDGTQVGSNFSDATALPGDTRITMGMNGFDNSNSFVDCYLDEFRISNYGRYSSNYTPAVAPFDPSDIHFSTVSTLLHFEGPNTSTILMNDGYLPTNYSLGGATITSSVSKFGTHALSVLGAGSAYSSSDTVYAMGYMDFTWECFTQYITLGSFNSVISNRSDSGDHSDQIALGFDSSANLVTYFSGGTFSSTGASGLAANTWGHVALCVQNGVAKAFCNGVQMGSAFVIPNLTWAQIYLGANGNNSQSLNGYIDDVRITRGVTRYFNTFTPPATQFADRFGTTSNDDAHWSQVIALLHFEGGTTDETGHTWTLNGTAVIDSNNSKFGSDSLLCYPNKGGAQATHADYILGTGDFTIEGWKYSATDIAVYSCLFDNRSGSDQGIAIYEVDGVGNTYLKAFDNSGLLGDSSPYGVPALNTWVHWAICRQAGVLYLSLGGTVKNIGADTRDYTGNTPFLGSNYLGVQIAQSAQDDFRITKGIARYTTDFVTPYFPFPNSGAASDLYFSDVVALVHMGEGSTNGDTVFPDIIGNTWTRSNVNVLNSCSITNAQPLYFGLSGQFDNRGLSAPRTPFDFGTGDFTFECRCFFGDTSVDRDFLGHRNTGDNNTFWFIRRTSGNAIRVFNKVSSSITCDVTTTSTTVAGSQWVSIKVQRKTGVIEVYIDGTKQTLSGSNITAGQSWAFPAFDIWIAQGDDSAVGAMSGEMAEVRLTKGIARYSGATITVESAPFPDHS